MDTVQLSQPVSPRGPAEQLRTTNIAILAMGGEGGGVLADWIVDMAEHSGYLAQTTSVPGVAQRTGSTIYYVEIFPEQAARTWGRDPVMALMPVPGEVDVVIASELMEAGRAVTRGLVTPDRTTLIASTNRVYSMTERTAMGDGRVDGNSLFRAGRDAAKNFIHYDFAQLAETNRSVISATLFGALAASNALPFTRKQFEDAIERSGVAVPSNRAAFAAGVEAATHPVKPAEPSGEPGISQVGPALEELSDRVAKQFPTSARAILLAAIQRLADFQDVAYAAEYLDKLALVKDLDRGEGHPLLRGTARYLALWMSYEDAIRVADLKIRRARFERVAREAHVADGQLLQIHEYLYPRVEEFTDIMPAGAGAWVLRTGWAARLLNRLAGKGKVLQTTSLRGFLELYFVASLRPRRRGTLRFQREKHNIENWLRTVGELAAVDYELACEVAECATLIKGYGDTHALGSRNFASILRALPVLRRSDGAALRVKNLREAALADENGKKLADALAPLGLGQGVEA
jgi:indolepyruvate ferredoxin oxidoreductase, beta subunit